MSKATWGHPGCRGAKDLLDHRGLLDEGDDAHGACATRADKGFHFVRSLDQVYPGTLCS